MAEYSNIADRMRKIPSLKMVLKTVLEREEKACGRTLLTYTLIRHRNNMAKIRSFLDEIENIKCIHNDIKSRLKDLIDNNIHKITLSERRTYYILIEEIQEEIMSPPRSARCYF